MANRLNVLKSELDDRCADINNLHALITKIQDDKAKLSKKITNLLENGDYIGCKLRQLSRFKLARILEKELVREVESLKYLKRSPSGAANARKPLPNKLDAYIKNLESERDFFKREIDTLQDLLKTSGNHQSRREGSPSKSPAKIARQKSSSPGKPASTRCTVCSDRSQSPVQHQQLAIEEIKKLKREKDELKSLLDKFEGYMEQVDYI